MAMVELPLACNVAAILGPSAALRATLTCGLGDWAAQHRGRNRTVGRDLRSFGRLRATLTCGLGDWTAQHRGRNRTVGRDLRPFGRLRAT